VAGFPLFTDANVDGRLIRALIQRGWPVHRSVDTFAEDEDDDVLFEHAAKKNLVFVTNDEDLLAAGKRWLEKSHPFRMIYWEKSSKIE
jgi:predicted nuclease of predicted toxin-antitoxin system